MSTIYRQSLKGIDEVAFKSTGLPLRLVSYLLVVDGEASIDQLISRHQNLPSMQAVLQGLQGQGFIEVAGTSANVVDIGQMRVATALPIRDLAPRPSSRSSPITTTTTTATRRQRKLHLPSNNTRQQPTIFLIWRITSPA